MKKMILGIDAGDFAPGTEVNSGIKRLIKQFTDEVKNYPEYQIHYYYFSEDKQKELSDRNIRYIQLPTRLYATLHLPLATLINRDDIFLGFAGVIPAMMKFLPIKKLAFIHDFGFYKYPEYYHSADRLIQMTEAAITKADQIVVFSEYVKRELTSRFPSQNAERVTSIYAGIDHIAVETQDDKKPKDYFLYVGVVKPIKDVYRLISCFSQYKERTSAATKLVIIGSKEEKYFEKIKNSEAYKKVEKSIEFIENISEQELRNYYHHARAVLNLSKEEGFGYPVLEGLVSGKKVIVNSIDLYKEYQKYFPNLVITDNDYDVIKEMEKVSEYKMITIPAEFTWKVFTKKLLTVIETI